MTSGALPSATVGTRGWRTWAQGTLSSAAAKAEHWAPMVAQRPGVTCRPGSSHNSHLPAAEAWCARGFYCGNVGVVYV
jgi:hypothetical protein